MRVLIVSAVYPPEPVMSGQTSAQIADALVASGHDVTVVTAFPSRPGGSLYPGYSRRLFQREDKDGYELIRCFAIPSPESSLIGRLLENASFGIASALCLLRSSRPDVVYSNTWPLVATFLIFSVARLRRLPLVVSVQDMYPESLVAQRRIRSDSWLARSMYWLDAMIARGCRKIIAISDSFADLYHQHRKVDRDRLCVIPNWIDDRAVLEDPDGAATIRARLQIPQSAFLLVYAGNIGMAAGVETLVSAFHHLTDLENLYLLIAGEGSNLEACHRLVNRLNCSRISFLTPWRKDETSAVLTAAQTLVLTTRGQQSIASVPSKLLSYMLAARPVVALAFPDAELAKLVNESNCGWVVEPDNPAALADAVRQVMSLHERERRQRGEDGREFVRTHLTRQVCLPRVIRVLENIGTAQNAS
jgi:colanic acid biosynthesis glycosyl transferase WcaI